MPGVYTNVNRKQKIVHVVVFAVGFSLAIASSSAIANLLGSVPRRFGSLSGFEVLHDCSQNLTSFIGLWPLPDSLDIQVSVAIENWKEIAEEVSLIEVHFPGFTSDHCYVTELKDLENFTDFSQFQRDLSDHMEFRRDYFNVEDIFSIYPKFLDDFTGIIEFIWMEGFERPNIEKLELLLPFQASFSSQGTQLNHLRDYTLEIWVPEGYTLTSSTPQPSRLQFLGDRKRYRFEIDLYKTDLHMSFENPDLSREKSFRLLILSSLFGLGLTLIIREIIQVVRPR